MIRTEDKHQSIVDLYTQICKFNYYKDFDTNIHRFNQQLDQLPRSRSQMFQDVPLSFINQETYFYLWRPLFIEELKGYVASARSSQSSKPEKCELCSYFDLGIFKIMEFKRLKDSKTQYNQGSLILLSPQKALTQAKQGQKCPHLIGISYRFDGSIHVRVLFSEQYTQKSEWQLFTTTKSWYIQNLCPLSSIQRQFKALSSFQKIQFQIREVLMKPHQNRLNASKTFNIPTLLQQKLKQMFNVSQLQAIQASLKQQGVTLIQGPPGTGKTKTLLGTLSVLLQSSVNRQQDQQLPLLMRWKTSQQKRVSNALDRNPWMKNGYQDWRDQPLITHFDSPLKITTAYPKAVRVVTLTTHKEENTAPSRVLVCGPSNASVDEVIRKMLKEQLFDGQGKSYLPAFVRVGQNYHESLQEYSLDTMAIKMQQTEPVDIFAVRKKILKQSRIVFTTLSSAGSSALQTSELQFDTVVIDEAGQAVQISSLIPLLYKCKRLILIGDPSQLPATVFSPVCLQHHYDQSLFQRLMKAQYPVSMLKTQYRMHPDISRVIGSSFYQGLLEDGNKMTVEPKGFPRAFLMLHIQSSYQVFEEQSYKNPVESKCVQVLVNHLSKFYQDIGVLSPYSSQVRLMVQQKMASKCQIKTIDSFQGRQKEVVIFSAVRAYKQGPQREQNPKRTIGFVGDGRRLNVALSRAKEVCVVVGDLHRLQMNKNWRHIIQEAKKRGEAFRIHSQDQLRKIGDKWQKLRSL